MRELIEKIPDVNVLLALMPEELGAKMLFFLRKRNEIPNHLTNNRGMHILSSLEGELWPQHQANYLAHQYPKEKRNDISIALSEAWVWLEAQGLLIPEPGTNGQNGWRRLSRRAQNMETEKDFADYRVTRLLPKENLHPKIADSVWGAFVRGEFDAAAFQAMKGVEVAVRAASGLGNDLVGVTLMRKAFAPQDGPLTDMSSEGGERQGRVDLFAGTIASYKNPHSHRDVNLNDPHEALEIIFLANHLLRIVDARSVTKKGSAAESRGSSI